MRIDRIKLGEINKIKIKRNKNEIKNNNKRKGEYLEQRVGRENFSNRWHSYAIFKKLAIPW